MKFPSFFHEKLGFTRNELKVVLLLSSTLLVGLGVRWYSETFSSPRAGGPSKFDYTRSDSEFLARTRVLDSLRSGLPAEARSAPGSRTRSFLNVNTASEHELMVLPGIGEKYAQRIVRFRLEHGAFQTVEELIQVRGIGPKTLERIRPLITVK
jgi:competence ComEA-like helix-hairpin-helix protein